MVIMNAMSSLHSLSKSFVSAFAIWHSSRRSSSHKAVSSVSWMQMLSLEKKRFVDRSRGRPHDSSPPRAARTEASAFQGPVAHSAWNQAIRRNRMHAAAHAFVSLLNSSVLPQVFLSPSVLSKFQRFRLQLFFRSHRRRCVPFSGNTRCRRRGRMPPQGARQ